MYPNQQQQLYTTRNYIYNPQSNYNGPSYDQSRPPVQPYPYYTNNQQPTTVTYVNNRPNYGQQPTSYAPPSTNRYPSTNTPIRSSNLGTTGGGSGAIEKTNMMSNENPFIDPARPYEQYNTPRSVTSITSQPKSSGAIEKTNMMSNENPFIDPARPYEQYNTPRSITSITSPPKSSGNIEKTNMMSSENPFIDPARPYEQYNTPRTVTSITSQPKSGGSVNKTLNLSDENPFHNIYGGYRYPAQIDPSKRITTQNTAVRSSDNKSLNLSDENPFYSTYGRYYYPSQIDPQKRITEIPKAAGPLVPTNEMSSENPFNNYQPSTYREYSNSGGGGSNSYSSTNTDWNRNNNSTSLSSRPIEPQKPSQNNYNQQQSSSIRQTSPPSPPRIQPQKPNPSAPLDKTSLNMSPDNPFAETYGRYHYPSSEEIKTQKRANERNNRFGDQQPVNNNNRPVQPTNQMTEYPETEKKEFISGKGNTKFTRFDVNF